MAQKDPVSAASKWVSAMQNASQDYVNGVNAVKVAPNSLAGAAADLWAANVAAAKSKYIAANAKVTLQMWQSAATSKGAGRLADGATAAQAKFQAFMQNYLPKVYSIVAGLPQRGNYSQNKTRLIAFLDQLHAAAGTF